jgi:hypothetical protein
LFTGRQESEVKGVEFIYDDKNYGGTTSSYYTITEYYTVQETALKAFVEDLRSILQAISRKNIIRLKSL